VTALLVVLLCTLRVECNARNIVLLTIKTGWGCGGRGGGPQAVVKYTPATEDTGNPDLLSDLIGGIIFQLLGHGLQ
jgi:hypothetical protein